MFWSRWPPRLTRRRADPAQRWRLPFVGGLRGGVEQARMAARDQLLIEITPQVLLKAYSCGIFPMAESAEDPALYWIEPQQRGVLPLNAIHLSSRLAQTIRNTKLQVRIDTDFEGVIEGCAASRPGRRTTWINGRIRSLYGELFTMGHCHTVEVWDDGKLVGGLYGVALHGAFFGESMFSYVRDASKIALMHLSARLIYGGFTLLDTQFVTEHLRQFGASEVERPEFHGLLETALACEGDFLSLDRDVPPGMIVEIIDRACGRSR
jgi:leucyl/phenylalanyl-tRNA---protein transferase